MKRGLLLTVLLVFLVSSRATAVTLDFYLTVNVISHTWTFSASTDAAGGLGAFAVDLENVEHGTSVAPRSVVGDVPLKGFKIGNDFYQYPLRSPLQGYQVFAGQFPLELDSIVYGIGYAPVPDSAFGVDGVGPLSMVGDATTVPTVLYTGTYDPSGPLPQFRPQQSDYAAIVYLSPPPPGGYDHPVRPDEINYVPEIIHYNYSVVPEPTGYILSAIGFLMLFWFRRAWPNRLAKCLSGERDA